MVYPDMEIKSFDYVILNQSLQQVKKPDIVVKEALRVGREVIIGFPNFAHYSARLQIFFRGKTPVTPSLPYEWHDTPNLHFLSISDFIEYCHQRDIKIKKSFFIGKRKGQHISKPVCPDRNLPDFNRRIGLSYLTGTKERSKREMRVLGQQMISMRVTSWAVRLSISH